MYLKVSNLGSLALKYQLTVKVASEDEGTNVAGEKFALSDYLVFKVVEIDEAQVGSYTRDLAKDASDTMKLSDFSGATHDLDAKDGINDEDYVAIIVYMPESVGNKANYRGTDIPTIKLGIHLAATQAEAESDSIGTDYDKDAWVEGMAIHDENDLKAAIAAGQTEITLQDPITLTSPIVIPETASTFSLRALPGAITIDLNGKSIRNAEGYEGVAIINNGLLILTGEGVIDAEGYSVQNNGIMMLDGITVQSGIENSGTLTIQSGSVSNETGETIVNNEGTVEIFGGTFDSDVSEFVADGFEAVENEDGSWSAQEKQIKTVTVATAEELLAALGNVTEETVIHADGVSIDMTDGTYFEIPGGVTLKGATINAKFRGLSYVMYTAGVADQVVLENCSFGNTNRILVLGGTAGGPKSVVYNDCTFSGAVLTNFVDNTDGIATFNGCTFTKSSSGTQHYTEAMGGTHVFKGCTFDYTGVTATSIGVLSTAHLNVYSEAEYSTHVILEGCTRTNCSIRYYGPNSTLETK